MLVTRQDMELFNQPYKFIWAVLNLTKQQQQQSSPPEGGSVKAGFHIALKFYVVYVNECSTHPILESCAPPKPTNKSGGSQQGSSGSSGVATDAGAGGEFTHVPPPS